MSSFFNTFSRQGGERRLSNSTRRVPGARRGSDSSKSSAGGIVQAPYGLDLTPYTWNKRVKKPIEWLLENRKHFQRIMAITRVSGQHALVDVVLDPDAEVCSAPERMANSPTEDKGPRVKSLSPGQVVQHALKNLFKNLEVSYFCVNLDTPPDAIVERLVHHQWKPGPLFSDIFVVENLHLASKDFQLSIREIMSTRRSKRPGGGGRLPLRHKFSIVAVCSHLPAQHASARLPLPLRELFLLSIRIDAPLIASKIQGDQGKKSDKRRFRHLPSFEEESEGDSKEWEDGLSDGALSPLPTMIDTPLKDESTGESAGGGGGAPVGLVLFEFFGLMDNGYISTSRARRQSKVGGRKNTATVHNRKAHALFTSRLIDTYLVNMVVAHRTHARLVGPTNKQLLADPDLEHPDNWCKYIEPLLECVRITSYLSGATYVLPWHVRYIVPYVMAHRMHLRDSRQDASVDVYEIAEQVSRSIASNLPCIPVNGMSHSRGDLDSRPRSQSLTKLPSSAKLVDRGMPAKGRSRANTSAVGK